MTMILVLIGLALFIYSFVYKGKAIMRIQNNTMKDAKPEEKKDTRLALFICMVGCAVFMIGLMPLLIKPKQNDSFENQSVKKINCMVCGKDLTDDYNRISPNGNGYYCTPCYRKTMKEINEELKIEGY